LLRAAGYEFDVRAADVDERVGPDEDPVGYVTRLSSAKSAHVLRRLLDNGGASDGLLVVGADTAVVVDGEILGKPLDEADARRMLVRLSGRPHQVMTGVSVRSTAAELTATDVTTVWFKPLTPADLDWYVRTGEGLDKAGGYGIQGHASRFVTRIDGSYSNVVGLPIATVHQLVGELDERGSRGCIR
jgi:septum formation protein